MISQIPGHVRAYTWLEMLLAGSAALSISNSWMKTAGMIILVVGMFLGNQATHLVGENHAGARMSWLEHRQQKYSRPFQILGLGIMILGIWIALR